MTKPKKLDFAFDVSALTEFKNENTDLVRESLFGVTTFQSGISVLPGQKGTVKLNKLATDINFQAKTCSWSALGDTTFTQQEVVVTKLTLQQALCSEDLTSYWMSQMMRAGSNPEELPFEDTILSLISENMFAEVEKIYWQGNTSSTDSNLQLVNGIGEFIDGKGATKITSTAPFTKSNIIAQVEAFITGFDAGIKNAKDLVIFMNASDYQTLTFALIAGQYPINSDSQAKPYGQSLIYPGTNVEIIATDGLNGVSLWYGGQKSNFVLVTDLLDEMDNVTIRYSEDNLEYRVMGSFKMGAGVYFPTQIVHNDASITS